MVKPLYGTTAIDIADLAEDIPNFSMFELTTEDWENLITWLKEEPIPPRHFQFDLAQFQQGDNWDDDEDFFSAESCLRFFPLVYPLIYFIICVNIKIKIIKLPGMRSLIFYSPV